MIVYFFFENQVVREYGTVYLGPFRECDVHIFLSLSNNRSMTGMFYLKQRQMKGAVPTCVVKQCLSNGLSVFNLIKKIKISKAYWWNTGMIRSSWKTYVRHLKKEMCSWKMVICSVFIKLCVPGKGQAFMEFKVSGLRTDSNSLYWKNPWR